MNVVLPDAGAPPVKIATAEPIEVAAKPVARPAEIKTTPAASTANAVWVVQVFSSPSRDDADEWLQTLREKRVQDGYIVEQTLRGQPWFRVRFGQFPTPLILVFDNLGLHAYDESISRYPFSSAPLRMESECGARVYCGINHHGHCALGIHVYTLYAP